MHPEPILNSMSNIYWNSLFLAPFFFFYLETILMKNEFLHFQLALTIWQTAVLFSTFFLNCLPVLLYGERVVFGSYVYIYPYAYTVANTTFTGSVWIVLSLTVDRFLALCYPFTHQTPRKK